MTIQYNPFLQFSVGETFHLNLDTAGGSNEIAHRFAGKLWSRVLHSLIFVLPLEKKMHKFQMLSTINVS